MEKKSSSGMQKSMDVNLNFFFNRIYLKKNPLKFKFNRKFKI